jgi:hypothetical protein
MHRIRVKALLVRPLSRESKVCLPSVILMLCWRSSNSKHKQHKKTNNTKHKKQNQYRFLVKERERGKGKGGEELEICESDGKKERRKGKERKGRGQLGKKGRKGRREGGRENLYV